MMIHEITPAAGAYKRRKRIGRGIGSGKGKTGGRGTKGYGSRSGNSNPHEGGGTPLFKRFPKRGFTNAKFKVVYQPVNLNLLGERFEDGDTVNPESMHKLGLVRYKHQPVKVLAYGTLDKKLTVAAHAISEKAHAAIEQAGGKVELLPLKPGKATDEPHA